ncbi:MAG: M24 family metallopeptidase [Nannocystaceae bacterium]|nr:Xaa-Pro peptidase family protein [bacterium]
MKLTRRGFSAMAIASCLTACRRGPAGVADVIATPTDNENDSRAGDYSALEGFCEGIQEVSATEYAERVAAVADAVEAAGLSAVLIEPGPNMQYVSGVRWGRSERPFLWMVRRDGEQAWVCPAFEQRSASERLPEGAEVLLWQEHEDPFAAVARFVGSDARLGVDPDARGFIFEGITAHVSGARIHDGPLAEVRIRKTPLELDRLRRANEATKAAIAVAATRLGPGMTQSAFAEELTAAQRAAGLDQVWCLALFGPAASFPHGTAEDRELREDDVVLVDTGGALHGYRSDVSRTWTVGAPSEQVASAWDAVARAQAAALAKIRNDVACRDPDAQARAVIEAAGFGQGYEQFTHRLGHGIGLQVHEPPYLRPKNGRVLRPGMTMSNEPGIYVAGEFGVRIEDIVAVTDGEPEVLGPPVGPFEDPLRDHFVA